MMELMDLISLRFNKKTMKLKSQAHLLFSMENLRIIKLRD